MAHPGTETPLRLALLRVTAFAAAVEAICFRLLPRAGPRDLQGGFSWVGELRGNLAQSGATAFVIALALCLALLMGQATRALGRRPGGPWINGLLAGCIMALITTSLSAAMLPVGPAFVAGFSLLSVLIVLLVVGQSYPGLETGWQRGCAVALASLMVCSCLSQLALVSSRAASARLAAVAGGFESAAASAGFLLAAAAGVLSFMAWSDLESAHRPDRPWRLSLEGALSGAGSLAFAAVCLFPPRSASMGALPQSWPAVAAASASLFLAGVTALGNMMTPGRAHVGYGLLFMILAGFPLRTALQNLLMVLGCLCLFETIAVPAEPATPAEPPGSGSEPGLA
jgi:hypothetical protein